MCKLISDTNEIFHRMKISFFKKTIDKSVKACIINKHLENRHRGVEQLVARRAHNPEVAGSSPVSATILSIHKGFTYEYSIFLLKKSFLLVADCLDLRPFLFCYAVMLSGNALGI